MHETDAIPIDDWLLTEAVRLREERSGRRGDDEAAVASALATGGTLSSRLAARAQALPGADNILADIRHLRRLARNLALGLIALGALSGALAARASIADRQVDILLAAAALLLVPTVMLMVWLVLVVAGARGRDSGSLAGGLLAAGLRRLGPRLLGSDHAAEVTLAGGRLLRTGIGRWLLSSLTHAFWIAYAVAALMTLAAFFSIVQYDLSWGTTLLSEGTVVALMQTLAQPPAALGLIPPAPPEWILAGREGVPSAEGRAQWARFLLAMIAVYGLLPRLVFALLSLLGVFVGLRRLAVDTTLPGYLRLSGALLPAAPATEHGRAPKPAPKKTRRRPRNPVGGPVLIGIELEQQTWPLAIPGIETHALGRADDRAGRGRLLSALAALRGPPPVLLIACSMLRTPDAGSERFIDRAADAAGTVPVLVLVEGALFAERGGRLASRLADWQALAERAGGEALLLDLDAPDAAAIARLLQWIQGSEI